MTRTLLFFVFLSSSFIISGQEDPVLFQIEDTPVNLSEFVYIYEKNNRDKADYSKNSLEEYLGLYINFKLKVQKGKDLGFDQLSSYKEELSGYRKQLASSYVIDKEVIDKMVDQIFERQKWDVKLSHILFKVPRKSSTNNIQRAEDNMDFVVKLLQEGEKFEILAKKFSEDKNSSDLGGDIGYITAPLSEGFIELEDAAYSLKKGENSDIIRTDLGFHLIKKIDIRQARGNIEAAHILIRTVKNGKPVSDAKARMDSVYALLESGKRSFESLAITYSEDKQTASKGGDLGVFGIGQYEARFEDMAFSLANDNVYTTPFRSSIGWHIIKRIKKRPLPSISQIKTKVKAQMNEGERFEIMEKKVIEKLKKESNFQLNQQGFDYFMDSIKASFYSYNWKIPSYEPITLISFEDMHFTVSDFASYCKSNTRVRLRSEIREVHEDIPGELLESFIGDKAIQYAQERLEDKYPDFKNLMREYEEGILLFEITKSEVWDKASADTSGLRIYYNNHRADYVWQDRARLTTYTIRSINKEMVNKIALDCMNKNPEDVQRIYNKEGSVPLVLFKEDTVEKNSESLSGLLFVEGHMSDLNTNNSLRVTMFKKIEKIFPSTPKSLKEAKGYIISDYQDQLETEWIDRLKEEYKIEIHQDIFQGLIQSE